MCNLSVFSVNHTLSQQFFKLTVNAGETSLRQMDSDHHSLLAAPQVLFAAVLSPAALPLNTDGWR